MILYNGGQCVKSNKKVDVIQDVFQQQNTVLYTKILQDLIYNSCFESVFLKLWVTLSEKCVLFNGYDLILYIDPPKTYTIIPSF